MSGSQIVQVVKTDHLKLLRRSKTINVSDCSPRDGKRRGEVSFPGEMGQGQSTDAPPLKPTSSCQALRHAVSSLTRIDDFILEELGDGFFANVYKATHRVTGEEMVMKINKDSANRASALREVQLMNRLSHPNILRFLGVCVHEGQLHALTEYIGGGTLEELLMAKEEELPWTLRIKLSLDLARGMRYLHTEGVFHRDLTSKNVLIKKGENKHYQAILADFGLATKIPDPRCLETLPSVGCPWWMAPEVINAKFYNDTADLFSFGIICLEITARIDADPDTMPRTRKFGVDYVLFVEMVDYCPLDYLQLAFKCCQVLPEKRPRSNVIIDTLEQIYKTLKTTNNSGRLHKRSRSEDNIISSESYAGDEEGFMTPQIIAQAMSKDDPHYSPSNVNPFAAMSKFKDGHKLLEFPCSKKGSTSSNEYSSSFKSVDHFLSASTYSQQSGISHRGVRESQSLPCSPEMLRRAAEKLHQASLHGTDAYAREGQEDVFVCLTSTQPTMMEDAVTPAVPSVPTAFATSRTRSLGALDFWKQSKGMKQRRTGLCQRDGLFSSHGDNSDIMECSTEDRLSCEDLHDATSLQSHPDRNDSNNHSRASTALLYTSSSDEFETAAEDLSGHPSLTLPSGGDFSPCSDTSLLSKEEMSDLWEEEEEVEAEAPMSEMEEHRAMGEAEVKDYEPPPIAEQSASFDPCHFGKPSSGSLSHARVY